MTTQDDHSRREFLATAAAATAVVGVLPALAMEQGGHTTMSRRAIKKSLKYGMIGEGSTVQEKFQAARDAGFDGVELDSPNDLDLDEVLAAKKAVGIEIPGVVDSAHWRDTLSHQDPAVREKGRAALEEAIRDAAAYGATTVLLVPGVVNDNVTYGEVWSRSQEEIRKVIPLCEELDIDIAIENVWNGFLMGPYEAARYIDEFDSPRVGFYFDVGNIVRYCPAATYAEVLGKRIKKLDIKEYSLERMKNEGVWKGFGVEIGEGSCDWPAVMAALDEIGYEGWASAEVGGGDAARLADISRRMDVIFASPTTS